MLILFFLFKMLINWFFRLYNCIHLLVWTTSLSGCCTMSLSWPQRTTFEPALTSRLIGWWRLHLSTTTWEISRCVRPSVYWKESLTDCRRTDKANQPMDSCLMDVIPVYCSKNLQVPKSNDKNSHTIGSLYFRMLKCSYMCSTQLCQVSTHTLIILYQNAP